MTYRALELLNLPEGSPAFLLDIGCGSGFALARAAARGALEPASSLAEAVADAELVVVAVPVGVAPAVVQEALAAAGSNAVVTDVASTKRPLAALIDPRFVPGHPVAGGATGGPGRAAADLFDAATWFLAPNEASSAESVALVERFVASIGARAVRTDAESHDRMLALTSHLPHALANLLMLRVAEDEDALAFAGASLREMTRLAGANAAVWSDIFLGNADEIALVQARPRKAPFVLMDMAAGARVNSVRIDGRSGARQAAEHLLRLGHRHFAIVAVQRTPSDPIWHPPSTTPRMLRSGFPLDDDKLLGYADALGAAGIPIDSVPLIEAYPPSPWAEQGAEQVLTRAPQTTAILAMSDKNAVAVIEVATRLGRRVPQDLSVVGFDDVDGAAATTPPLTTVRQDIVGKGRAAAQMLFAAERPQQQVLPVELVVRSSTAPPRPEPRRRRRT